MHLFWECIISLCVLFVFLVCLVCHFLAPSTSVAVERSDEEEEAEVSESFICQPRYWHHRHALLLTNLSFLKTHSEHTEMYVDYPPFHFVWLDLVLVAFELVWSVYMSLTVSLLLL